MHQSEQAASEHSLSTQISTVTIAHGSLRYTDFRSSKSKKLEEVNARIGGTSLDGTPVINGTASLSGRRIAFQARATTPARFFSGLDAKAEIAISSDLLHAHFAGIIAKSGDLNGNIELDTPSARQTALWLGARPPDTKGFGSFSIKSYVTSADRVVELRDMHLALDGAKVTGDLSVDLHGDVPFFKGSVSADRLDLSPYIEHQRGKTERPSHRDKAGARNQSLWTL